jgi:hypothetical protein
MGCWGCDSVVRQLPCIYKDMSFIHSSAKIKRGEGEVKDLKHEKNSEYHLYLDVMLPTINI